MKRNILELLEETADRVPEKLAFADEQEALTFRQVRDRAMAIGSGLAEFRGKPVAVLMGRRAATVTAFLGVLYAGCQYVPLDDEIPPNRLKKILQKVAPEAVICEKNGGFPEEVLQQSGQPFDYEDLICRPVDRQTLERIRRDQIDLDPAYIVFTSGSTGTPKGVQGCHRAMIDYAEALAEILRPDEHSVFGSQAPLSYDACLKEILMTLKFGATTWIIPKRLFLFPLRLVEFLVAHKIDTLCWVVPALTMISAFHTFDKLVPRQLKTVAFAGDVFPRQQLLNWREALPETRFLNLYGPTEATGICCWYEVGREIPQVLPIGRPLPNTGILLLDGENRPGDRGEICVRGSCLTLGYYGEPEKTARAFEVLPSVGRIYRTGDLGRYNDRGELEFCGRRDSQIKHMGHRIEPGDIEAAAGAVPEVGCVCCLCHREKICLLYEGGVEPGTLAAALKKELPRYMLPNRYLPVERLPRNANGKLDRKKMLEIMEKERES